MHYVLDAKNQKLGRLASEVAMILQDKKKPTFDPKEKGVDSVVVKNLKAIEVTGNKAKDKIYYHHTGYVGHLREESFESLFKRIPERVFKLAVWNMLPKNSLRASRIKRLKIEL
jgi:large subunit ribosomal protein L13